MNKPDNRHEMKQEFTKMTGKQMDRVIKDAISRAHRERSRQAWEFLNMVGNALLGKRE